MLIKRYLIAGGNSTVLVWDYPSPDRKEFVNELLKTVEQVGFVLDSDGPALEMMGNELCINATIALASTLGKQGKLKTSGLVSVVEYKNSGTETTLSFPLGYKLNQNIVTFPGIGFQVIDYKPVTKPTNEDLDKMCTKYNLPAFGVVYLSGGKITPFVYVKDTNSLVKETACGSGSIAASIITGINKIIQPTGETLKVQVSDTIQISGKVVEVRL